MSRPPTPKPTPPSIPQIPASAPSGSSSNIEAIFEAALKSYKNKTKKDLKKHDLFKQLESCDSPAAILAVFQASHFDQSRMARDDRLKKWLVPTINVLCAFSETLGEGISLVNIDSSAPSVGEHALMSIRQVFSPAKVIFAGVGVLLLVSVYSLVHGHVMLSALRRLKAFLRA